MLNTIYSQLIAKLYFLLLDSVESGGNVIIYLKGTGDPPREFRGFLLQALDDGGNHVGNFSFDAAQKAECLKCGSDNTCDSVTHKNTSLKSKVVATWTSPSSFTGTIYFRYTIVTEYVEYWVALEGPTLIVE